MTFLRALCRRDDAPCSCGCPFAAHEHFRLGSDCGACGRQSCPRFDPVDLDQVRRDHEVIEAVRGDDLDRALDLAPPVEVALLCALRDLRAAS